MNPPKLSCCSRPSYHLPPPPHLNQGLTLPPAHVGLLSAFSGGQLSQSSPEQLVGLIHKGTSKIGDAQTGRARERKEKRESPEEKKGGAD